MDLRVPILTLSIALGAVACSVADGGDGLAPVVSADPSSTTAVSKRADPSAGR
jgi:hypothetical protein